MLLILFSWRENVNIICTGLNTIENIVASNQIVKFYTLRNDFIVSVSQFGWNYNPNFTIQFICFLCAIFCSLRLSNFPTFHASYFRILESLLWLLIQN